MFILTNGLTFYFSIEGVLASWSQQGTSCSHRVPHSPARIVYKLLLFILCTFPSSHPHHPSDCFSYLPQKHWGGVLVFHCLILFLSVWFPGVTWSVLRLMLWFKSGKYLTFETTDFPLDFLRFHVRFGHIAALLLTSAKQPPAPRGGASLHCWCYTRMSVLAVPHLCSRTCIKQTWVWVLASSLSKSFRSVKGVLQWPGNVNSSNCNAFLTGDETNVALLEVKTESCVCCWVHCAYNKTKQKEWQA